MRISSGLAEDAVRLWPAIGSLTTVEGDAGLGIASRKLRDTYGRMQHEDRIIDIAILLESTLLHGIGQELNYRFALRGSLLLREVRDPTTSFDEFRRLYKVRSQIVHEGARLKDILRGSGETPVEFVDHALGLARDTLRLLFVEVEQGTSLAAVLERIDRQAIVGPSRR